MVGTHMIKCSFTCVCHITHMICHPSCTYCNVRCRKIFPKLRAPPEHSYRTSAAAWQPLARGTVSSASSRINRGAIPSGATSCTL